MTLDDKSLGGSHQGHLTSVLNQLFPGENILSNVRKEGNVVNPSTGYFLEIDLWLPNHLIGFEFQDAYHYITTWDSQATLESIKKNDESKKEKLQKRGETVVIVPCWWNASLESLKASVSFQRPDLQFAVHTTSHPIPLNPPHDFFLKQTIPGVGELMPASFPTSFNSLISPQSPWWMGEKYDGIRFCWHATNKQLYTRSGLTLDLPEKHAQILHSSPFLDGEIWFGRGFFIDSQKFMPSSNTRDLCSLRMTVFDNPEPKLQFTAFEKRYETLIKQLDRFHPFVITATRMRCISEKKVEKVVQELISDGGEGIILRKPGSLYEQTRSSNLIKLKSSRGDKEALVIEVLENNSLLLKLPNGMRMTVERENIKLPTTPKRGDIVTFSFDNYTKTSVPVGPKVFRIRTDITWEDVLHNDSSDSSKSMNEVSQKVFTATVKPQGYWTTEKGKNMRELFIKIARDQKLDPLVASTWYSISTTLREIKEVRSSIRNFSGSIVLALKSLFPEIVFDDTMFIYITKKYWSVISNRRLVFLNYAKHHKFDPLISENWYNIPSESILSFKGGSSIRDIYKGSVANALIHLFPEVGLERHKFAFAAQGHWTDLKNRRKILEDYAKWKGFDPLVPKYWYAQHSGSLSSFRGANSMSNYYSGNFRDAIMHLFPELKLDMHKFLFLSRYQSKSALNARNRRIILEHFARSRGKDPLNPEFWYSVNPYQISATKTNSVIQFYNGSLTKALLTLFPDIGLEESQLPPIYDSMTTKPNVEVILEQFATKNGFDPLDPAGWYSVTLTLLLSSEIQLALQNYDYNFIKALFDVYPNIGLEESKFTAIMRNSWIHSKNRQRFIDIAVKHHFDPLMPNNWYLVAKIDIIRPVMSSVATYYGGSVVTALLKLFPDIGLQRSLFV